MHTSVKGVRMNYVLKVLSVYVIIIELRRRVLTRAAQRD
jgi:hypothetical protein